MSESNNITEAEFRGRQDPKKKFVPWYKKVCSESKEAESTSLSEQFKD